MLSSKVYVEHLSVPVPLLLSSTYLPSFQRLEDQEHTKTISDHLLQYYQHYQELFLPGTISLGKLPDKDKWILFDGQHRLRAIELVTQSESLDEQSIRIDLYHVSSEEDARKLYHIINSNKKVDLFTGNIEPYVLPQIQKYMIERFSEYCKTTKNPKCLNINVDQMAKRMQAYKLVDRLNLQIDQAPLVIERIRQLNSFYQNQPRSKFIEWGFKEFDKRFGDLTYSNNPFYLGLYRNYEWIERLLDPSLFEDQEHVLQEKQVKTRTKIPKDTRIKVWNKRFPNQLAGECYCCDKPVHFTDFDCGHVLSAKDGGPDTVENLEPICRVCNLDMGSIHLEEYKKLIQR